MKLQKIKSINEAIENFGRASTFNPNFQNDVEYSKILTQDKVDNSEFNGGEFLPDANTNIQAVMPVSYSDAVKRVAVWRDKANELIETRRNLALECSGADIETDRYSHMSDEAKKLNSNGYESCAPADTPLNSAVLNESLEDAKRDDLLCNLAAENFKDWRSLAICLLNEMDQEQLDHIANVICGSQDTRGFDAKCFPMNDTAKMMYNRIEKAQKEDAFRDLLHKLYPDKVCLDMDCVNNLLNYDADFLYKELGMTKEEEN